MSTLSSTWDVSPVLKKLSERKILVLVVYDNHLTEVRKVVVEILSRRTPYIDETWMYFTK